jgi:hypothetical protein
MKEVKKSVMEGLSPLSLGSLLMNLLVSSSVNLRLMF